MGGVENIKQELNKRKLSSKQPDSTIIQKSFFLFLSLDLTNSTAFKQNHPEKWMFVLKYFFRRVESLFEEQGIKGHIWKRNGDEIIFLKKIQWIDELPNFIIHTYDLLINISREMEDYADFPRELSVKGAIWSALLSKEPKLNSENTLENEEIAPNFYYYSSDAESVDYLGPDIDLGFRIAKLVEKNRLVVDAKLASVLIQLEQEQWSNLFRTRLKIVSLKSLKGVWQGRPYPIIWYEKDWNKFSESIKYDEHVTSNLIGELYNHNFNFQDIQIIDEIFEDNRKQHQVDDIIMTLKSLGESNDRDAVEDEDVKPKVEMHCVVCIFNSKGEVFIAKRHKRKKNFPELWEFGCGQLKQTEDFGECLKREYETDFGFKHLNFGESGVPRPIGTYSFEKHDPYRKISGIVFVAKSDEPIENSLTNKHPTVEWANEERIAQILPEECVEGFHDRIKRAREELNRIFN